jgi:nucleoside-diphosphate-sugar epimerase
MMRIAILGATSQIARDLIVSFSAARDTKLHLFARRPEEVGKWLTATGLSGRYPADQFSELAGHEFDTIINFVGAGNPAQIQAMGSSIFDVTLHFDEMVMDYLKVNPSCRYLFMSSGAVYGSDFSAPATRETRAVVPINDLAPQDWYGAAKLYAECRHRAHPQLSILDIRVFNYFSRTQDISARSLMADILRAIRDKTVLKTSPDFIVRDFLHPSDFHALVGALLASPPANAAVDCYSRTPIDKPQLLAAMREHFGLRFEISDAAVGVNATGGKPHYYSLNTRAADFGYQPSLTSLEGVIGETTALLAEQNTRAGIN